jgi:hypothetical protein
LEAREVEMTALAQGEALVRRAKGVDYGPQINTTIWFLTAVSAIFLGLRLYCKIWRNRSIWWDDGMLVLAWVSAPSPGLQEELAVDSLLQAALASSAALESVSVSLGFGRHNVDISGDDFSRLLLVNNAAGFATILAAAWSKTSFAMTLLRISTGKVKIFVWFVLISVNLMLAATSTVQWAQCRPIERLWNNSIAGKCMERIVVIRLNAAAAGESSPSAHKTGPKQVLTATPAYSGISDIVLALVPWKIIWHVSIYKKEKFGALFAMSMGVL